MRKNTSVATGQP